VSELLREIRVHDVVQVVLGERLLLGALALLSSSSKAFAHSL